jgi:hypothetical protein
MAPRGFPRAPFFTAFLLVATPPTTALFSHGLVGLVKAVDG